MPDGFRLHGMEYDPPRPQEPWTPTVRRVAQLLRAGATVRTAGPYVEINLPGRLVLTDHAVHQAALAAT
jgi:hypothetical protein